MNTYDPFNTIRETFAYNLSTYGTTITVGGKTIKALFKLEGENAGLGSGTNKNQHLTMFTDYSESIDQGQELVLNGKHYIVLKDNSDENTIYNRSKCIDCNQAIKYELKHTDDKSKADLTTFYAYGEDISAVNSTTGGIITIQSTCHFMFPLNDLTRRIQPNDRFYAGQSYSGVWKVRDLNYQNGVCDVYCIRDTTKETDDPDNMIANRWVYERIPDAYSITLSPESIKLIEGQTQKITVAIDYNELPLPAEKIEEVTYIIDNPEIVSVDPKTNILTCLKKGKATVTAKYEPKAGDTSKSNAISVEVMEEPAYTFKVTLSPKNIELHPDENKTLTVKVTKDNVSIPTPEIQYVVEPKGFATVDATTNTITAHAIGKCTITGSYKKKDRDIAIADTVEVNVVEVPVVSDTYKVTLTPKDIKLAKGKTQQLTIVVTKNDEPFEPTPEIEYSVSPAGVATVSPSGLITATGVGTCTITGSYKANPNDTAITDKVTINVSEVVQSRIYVDPPYNASGHFNLKEHYGVHKFVCRAEGIENPKWQITFDPMSADSSLYKYSINEAEGTFEVECINMGNCPMMKFTIMEMTRAIKTKYYLKLASMF